MNNPTIVIAHKIKGRLRIKLSHPLRNLDDFKSEISNKNGVLDFSYNEITKSIIIRYDNFKVKEEEILLRIVAIYSKGYDLIPIRFIYNSKRKNMPPMAYYSLITLLIGGVSRYISMNERIKEFINWAVVGTTIGAIGEHAYNEINQKGYFDPEVVSVMYLINSIGKGKFLIPSGVTWITTFGRHLLEMSYTKLIIEVNEFKNKCSDEKYYNITILPDSDNLKKANMLRVFLEKFIEGEGNTLRKSFMISNKGVSSHDGRMFEGFESGPTFINVNSNNNKQLIEDIKLN